MLVKNSLVAFKSFLLGAFWVFVSSFEEVFSRGVLFSALDTTFKRSSIKFGRVCGRASWEMDNFTLENDRTVKISRPYWQTVRKTYACYLVQTEDR